MVPFHIYNGVTIVSRKKLALESIENTVAYGFNSDNSLQGYLYIVNDGGLLSETFKF